MKKRLSDRVIPDGERIKSLIAEKGLKLKRVAERAGIDERTLDKVLAGERVKVDTLQYVAGALGVRYEELLASADGTLPSPGGQPVQQKITDTNDDMSLAINILQELQGPSGIYGHEKLGFSKKLRELLEEQLDLKCDLGERLIRRRERERKKKEWEESTFPDKRINIYYVPRTDNDGNKLFVYLVAPTAMHELFMRSIEQGKIPEFAAIVADGRGEPTPEIKEYMLEYFGFKYDEY